MRYLKNNNLISFVAELDFKKRYEYANLLLLKKNLTVEYLKYPFLYDKKSYLKFNHLIVGNKINKFSKLELIRIGYTGMTKSKNHIYVAGFNFILQINRKDLKINKIISCSLMNDLHSIFFYKNHIYFIVPGIDSVVKITTDGKIIRIMTIDNKLNVKINDKKLLNKDIRFRKKIKRGPTGYFHINFIRIKNQIIYLTSRNLSSIMKLNKNKCELHPIGKKQRLLLHDGKLNKKFVFFTSINGLVLKIKDKFSNAKKLFNNSITAEIFNLNKLLKRKISWTRGININNDYILVLIDGYRFSQINLFKILIFKGKKIIKLIKIKKKIYECKTKIMAGFDIIDI